MLLNMKRNAQKTMSLTHFLLRPIYRERYILKWIWSYEENKQCQVNALKLITQAQPNLVG